MINYLKNNSKVRWLIIIMMHFLTVLFIGGGICLNKSYILTSFLMAWIAGILYLIVIIYSIFDLIKYWKKIDKYNIVYMISYFFSNVLFILALILYRKYYKPINDDFLKYIGAYDHFSNMTILLPRIAISTGLSLLFNTTILNVVIFINSWKKEKGGVE